MIQELIQDLKAYFNSIENPSEREKQLLIQLNSGYFPITTVHRNDLDAKGFDVKKISDDEMDELARKMADDYCTQLFWDSMEIIASEILNFPKIGDEKPRIEDIDIFKEMIAKFEPFALCRGENESLPEYRERLYTEAQNQCTQIVLQMEEEYDCTNSSNSANGIKWYDEVHDKFVEYLMRTMRLTI